jgi:hypothetical protein
VRVPLLAPADPGAWELALTLVQEQVAWFDDLDPASAVRGRVRVEAAPERASGAVAAASRGETG